MKNLQKIAVLLLTVFMFSCGSSGDEPTGGDAFLTADVAGASFASMKASVGATETNGVLAVQGSTANGDYIRLNIFSYNGAGTYVTGDAITNTNSLMYGTITPSVAAWTSTFNIGQGTIRITEDTATHVKGTFSFSGFNAAAGTNKQVSSGEFSAPK